MAGVGGPTGGMSAGLGEELLADDDTKDVEIEMLDGVILAHSAVLSVRSDALRGLLKHGVAEASVRKRLSWKEHSMEAGRFLIRLLYTECTCGEAVLPVLLGALEIAKKYLIDWPMSRLVSAVKARLTEHTFDGICSTAINRDISVLRMHCVHWAQQQEEQEHEKALILKDGDSVEATRLIRCEEPPGAVVQPGTLGDLGPAPVGDDGEDVLLVYWRDPEDISLALVGHEDRQAMDRMDRLSVVADSIMSVKVAKPSGLRKKFEDKELAPEVLSELAGLWEPSSASRKRPRLSGA